MPSFIRRSDPGVRSRLAVLATALGLLVAVHVALEATAQFAERHLDAMLWKPQNHLPLFSPWNHVDRGATRLLIYGPSEAREGLLPEELAPWLDGLQPYQSSQSTGTLEDCLLLLEYIEREYGPSAIPRALLLGITTRFIADIYVQPSPLQSGMVLYSPHLVPVGDDHPPALVPRGTIDSLKARWRLRSIQPDRYRLGLWAVGTGALTAVAPALVLVRPLWVYTRPAKYFETGQPPDRIKAWIETPGNHWEKVHNWDPEASRPRVTDELGRLMSIAKRNDIALFVVNMPETSWNRQRYKPGRYEAYLSIVRSAIGTTPFLDLRTFLADEEFYDDSHPLWPAGRRVSERVGRFIQEPRHQALHGGRP
jgi:hypothetical protein